MEELDKNLHLFFFFNTNEWGPKGFFKGGRGLRQGDLLSPYLLIMVADLLGRMMIKVNSVGLVQSFYPNGGGLSVLFI